MFAALALVFVLEGLLPFINPAGARKMYFQASQLDDKTLRFVGLASMIAGLFFLYWIR
ncbi:MAG: DUF2065 domain-containing protein [Pseudomonadota bacterium]